MAFTPQTYSVGEVLAASKLNQMDANIDAVRTFHKGSAAPSDTAGGIIWLDDSVAGAWELKLYDGTDWIGLARIDETGNASVFNSIVTGTYTGDGATSNGITGLGIAPGFLIISTQRTGGGNNVSFFFTSDSMVDNHASGLAVTFDNVSGRMESIIDAIISLDSDGFTVDDNGADDAPNANGIVYEYIAWAKI